jgi:ABC-type glycerol-3-phosphate transport system substrate-binding protein
MAGVGMLAACRGSGQSAPGLDETVATPAATEPAPAAAAPPGESRAAPDRATTLEMYSTWGGPYIQAWGSLAEIYERARSEIGIEVTFTPGHEDNPVLMDAVAAGTPPDVAMIADFSTPQWAELGVMTDLTPYVENAGLSEDDFWPAAWQLMHYQGKVWQLPFQVDPNFPFFWNKTLFAEAGLDPERGPSTIDEATAYAQQINRIENGAATRAGIIPWQAYGFGNSIYTWGWAFGGAFFDEGKQEVTPEDELVVAALRWMADVALEFGGPDHMAVTPDDFPVHPFGAGAIGMAPLVSANLRDILRYDPDLQLGAGLLPSQPPGERDLGAGAWIAGWRLFIPQGAADLEAAWEFIHWITATPEGAEAEWNALGFLPGWKHAPILEQIKGDPVMGVYANVLENAKHAKDPIPVGSFFQQQLEEMTGEAVYGRMDPLAAMLEVKQRTMAEWQRFQEQAG